MSAPTDTNQNFDQAELEQLVFIVLENMKTKNDRFYPHRFQLFKSLGLKRLLELFKTNDLPSWVVDACVSDRDEANHWSWYDLCDIPDELLLNYIDTFGKDSPQQIFSKHSTPAHLVGIFVDCSTGEQTHFTRKF